MGITGAISGAILEVIMGVMCDFRWANSINGCPIRCVWWALFAAQMPSILGVMSSVLRHNS